MLNRVCARLSLPRTVLCPRRLVHNRVWDGDADDELRHRNLDEWLEEEWRSKAEHTASSLGTHPKKARALYVDFAWDAESEHELLPEQCNSLVAKYKADREKAAFLAMRKQDQKWEAIAEEENDVGEEGDDEMDSRDIYQKLVEEEDCGETDEQIMLRAHLRQTQRFSETLGRLDKMPRYRPQRLLDEDGEATDVSDRFYGSIPDDYLDPATYHVERPYHLDPDNKRPDHLMPELAGDYRDLPAELEVANLNSISYQTENLQEDPFGIAGMGMEEFAQLPKSPELRSPRYKPEANSSSILEGFNILHVRSYLRNKIVASGRVETHCELIVGGNGRGVGSYGYGRGRSSAEAMDHAKKDMARNLLYIPLSADRNLWGPIWGKDKGSRVDVKTTIGKLDMKGPLMETLIMNLIGIRGFTCMTITNGNHMRRVRALFKALSDAPNPMDWADATGRPVLPTHFYSSRAHVEPNDLGKVIDPAEIFEGGFEKKQEADLILRNLTRLKQRRQDSTFRY